MSGRILLASLAVALACVAPAAAAPVIAAPPTVVGDAAVGRPLAVRIPPFAGATADDATLTWERSADVGFLAIPDAHEPSYAPVPADAGRLLRVHLVVETPDGVVEAWSAPTAPVRAAPARLRVGAARGAPVRLGRWVVTAGDAVAVTGRLPGAVAEADARIVLEPTVPTAPARVAVVDVDDEGRVRGAVAPVVNSVAWLELARADEPVERLRLGVVGVRPRIALALGAAPDGRDAAGRRLIRDLRILRGSAVLPHVQGLRLSWEGRLPGDAEGTAVCRTGERVVSRGGGALRGGCRTRGAWASARWRLVADPGSDDPGASAFLRAASPWVLARVLPAR